MGILRAIPELRWATGFRVPGPRFAAVKPPGFPGCLLYTSDAADDLLCVDLGGRRIIKKKNYNTQASHRK